MKEEELFEVKSEYTSAAVKTAQALEDWWKKSPPSLEVLKVFPYSLCAFECLLRLLPVYSTIEERKNVGIIPSSTIC